MLHSLYAKEFFKASEWLIKLIHKHGALPEPPCPTEPHCPKPPEPHCPKPPRPSCPAKPHCPKPPEPHCPAKPHCPKPPKPSCPAKPPCNNQCNCCKTENGTNTEKNINSLEISALSNNDIQHNYIETDTENNINIFNNTPDQPQLNNNTQNSFNTRRSYNRRILGDRIDFSSYNSDYTEEDDD